MMNKKRGRINKKSQVTLFVILAIVIIVAIAAYFVLKDRPFSFAGVSPSEDPQAYMKKCVAEKTKEAVDKLIETSGFEEPKNYLLYEDEKIEWICYTPNKLEICENKHPMHKVEVEAEIYRLIKPDIEKCFSIVKNKLKNFNYKESEMNLSVEIKDRQVFVAVKKDISFDKQGKNVEISDFSNKINSPIYDFLVISNRISNEEVTCECGKEVCNADIIGLNRFYRDFETTRFVTARNEKVYTIKEIITGQIFRVAVRNCVRLPY